MGCRRLVILLVLLPAANVAAKDPPRACFVTIDRTVRNLQRMEEVRKPIEGRTPEDWEKWKARQVEYWGVEVDQPVVWGRFHLCGTDGSWKVGTFTRYLRPESPRAFVKHLASLRGAETTVDWTSDNEVSLSTPPSKSVEDGVVVTTSFADFHYRIENGLLLLLPDLQTQVDSQHLADLIRQAPDDDEFHVFLPQNIPQTVREKWIEDSEGTSILGPPHSGEPPPFQQLRRWFPRDIQLSQLLLRHLDSVTQSIQRRRVGMGPRTCIMLRPVADSPLESLFSALPGDGRVTLPENMAIGVAVNARLPRVLAADLNAIMERQFADSPLASFLPLAKQLTASDEFCAAAQLNLSEPQTPVITVRVDRPQLAAFGDGIALKYVDDKAGFRNVDSQVISGKPLPIQTLATCMVKLPPESVTQDMPAASALLVWERAHQRAAFREYAERFPDAVWLTATHSDNQLKSAFASVKDDADLTMMVTVQMTDGQLKVQSEVSDDLFGVWRRRVSLSSKARNQAVRRR